jgi:hypothetical protein
MAGRILNRGELRKQAAGSKPVAHEQLEDILIADKRAGLSPADIVEQRFRVLLNSSALKVGMPRLCFPRADGRTRRAIEYASLGEPKEGASRREANLGQGESIVYAISIEQSHATEILAKLRPGPCRFWHTDYRGLLLIHGRTPKPAKGVCASDQGSRGNALLGVVELVDCIPSAHPDGDPDEVEYHWLLANPRTLIQPLPYPGRLGLFLVSEKMVAAVLRQLGMS